MGDIGEIVKVREDIYSISCKRHPDWLSQAVAAIRVQGCAVVTDVLSEGFLEATRKALRRAQQGILNEIGAQRLSDAGEAGVLRLMMKFEPYFFKFFEIPEVLAMVDQTVSETAILHLQNGFILPSRMSNDQDNFFQYRFHQDFPRVLNGYMASINIFFAIDEFTQTNGATWVIPGSHQKTTPPNPEYLEARAAPVECPAGSMIVFDSTLWHAAGLNTSGQDRLAINHQFTRSYIKQQIDYVRALGHEAVQAQGPRTQQLLGWYTRVVTSLDEYYRPPERRLYRQGQG